MTSTFGRIEGTMRLMDHNLRWYTQGVKEVYIWWYTQGERGVYTGWYTQGV